MERFKMFAKRAFIFYMYKVALVKNVCNGVQCITCTQASMDKLFIPLQFCISPRLIFNALEVASGPGMMRRRWEYSTVCVERRRTLIARFIWQTWDPSGADRTQVGPMLAPWTLLSGQIPRFHTGLIENHGPVIITFVIHSHTFCNIIVPSSTVDHRYMYHRNRAIPNMFMTYEIQTVNILSSWVIRTKLSWIKRAIKQLELKIFFIHPNQFQMLVLGIPTIDLGRYQRVRYTVCRQTALSAGVVNCEMWGNHETQS